MTVLIVGGAGYLGSALAMSLQDDVGNLRIMDNMIRERYCTLQELDDFEFYEGDIRSKKDLQTCLSDVETVFCLSDLTNAGKSFKREDETYEINFEGVTTLFDTAEAANVENFVYTSTASVYGDTPGKVDESFDCNPVSPYGKAKLKAEKYILSNQSKTDLNATALRLGTVHGYSVGMRFDTVINYFTFLACQGKPLTVHKSSLEEYRPYVNVKDVVRAYRFAYKNIEDMRGEQYNIIYENRKMEEVVAAIEKVLSDIETVHTENPTDNKLSYQLSNQKVRSLGFNTKHSIEEGVKDIREQFSHINTVS